MTVAEYDAGLVQSVATTLNLRPPNADALDALAKAIDTAPHGAERVADLATGVGKTYVAGALLDYLYESGVRNVVIVTPGSTIQRKTIDNLTAGHPKYLRGLQCRPVIITLDDFERGIVGQALDDETKLKVFVLTVQSLLRPDTKENRRAHRDHETLGQSLSDHLRGADDLVVIADEHHVYFSGNARKFQSAITELDPSLLIGLTATPHESTPRDRIVYHYPLADAIADGYVKIPVLVARTDGLKDTRTQLSDGVALLNAKRAAMQAYCERTKQTFIEPVMFVVAQSIDEANRVRDILVGPDLLGDSRAVLLVTSEEPEATLRTLDGVEEPSSGVRAVVSVSMLKEGWDVKNIYVIAAVRAMESQLLTEQILGRGLRLPFGKRTGIGMLDSVEVLSHHKFAELLERADVLLAQTLGQRAEQAAAVVTPTPGLAGTPVSLPGTAGATASQLAGVPVADTSLAERVGQVTLSLPGAVAGDILDPDQMALSGVDDDYAAPASHDVGGLSTIQARLDEATTTQEVLTTIYPARAPGGATVPLFIPRVSNRWEREPFSLTMVNAADAEALGAQFAQDHAPSLRRKALDAVRDEEGVRLQIADCTAEAQVEAYQPRLPFDSIETDLVVRLLASNDVAATVTESNAATSLAGAFIKGAGVAQQTPWRAEHAQLATEALVGWLRTKQWSTPKWRVAEVEQVKWPEPPSATLNVAPANRHLITDSKKFSRGRPYFGWNRSVFEVVAFDAYSTEFRLAEVFDACPGIKAWVRITSEVPLAIGYSVGAISKIYLPDFIVIDDADVHWVVEGKADTEMTDPVVTAKRDAAREWVAAVNASRDVHARWGYLLASESGITAAAGSWAAMKAANETFS